MDSLIQQFVQGLDGNLSPLKTIVQQFSSSDTNFDPLTGAIRLSHRPAVGLDAYAFILYPGVNSDVIERYESIHRARTTRYMDIPAFYKVVLGHLNGAFVFETALFGVPPSMARNPPLLDRSVQQPLDVGTANEDWRLEYKVDHSRFFFASGSHSHTENVGYFLTPDNHVEGFLRSGNQVAQWETLEAFLAAEIERAKSRYAEYEQMMETAQREFKSKRKKR